MAVPRIRFKDDNGQYFPDWSTGRIKDFGYFYYGKSAPKWSVTEDARTPCVRYGELYSKFNGIVDKIYSYTNIEKSNLKFSKGNEVLVPRVGEKPLDFARCSYLPFKDVAIGEMISVYNTHQNPLFISILFNATCKNKFARLVEGGNVSNLYFRYLEEVEINIPKKEEQQKIATFLTAVDKRISLLQKKVALLEDYQKGVMQQLFSQQLRFKDDNGQDFPDWEEKKVGSVLKERNIKTPKNENYPLMSFVAKKGVVPKGERYNREFLVSDSDNKNYKQTEIGDFIYSSNNLGTGSIGLNKTGSACISPVYSIFEINSSCNKKFIESYFTRKMFIYKMIRFRQGVVYGQWRIHESEFLKIIDKIPSLKEQQKIASFLESLDKKIETVNKQLEGMQSFKKGLLQQMFV